MNQKISKALSEHRFEQAKEDLEVAKLLYNKSYLKAIELIIQYFTVLEQY